jgi:hypothetical protein
MRSARLVFFAAGLWGTSAWENNGPKAHSSCNMSIDHIYVRLFA